MLMIGWLASWNSRRSRAMFSNCALRSGWCPIVFFFRAVRRPILSCRNKNRQVFVDVWTPMLDQDGMPRAELFLKDQLHMNDSGYEIWNKLVVPQLVTTGN